MGRVRLFLCLTLLCTIAGCTGRSVTPPPVSQKTANTTPVVPEAVLPSTPEVNSEVEVPAAPPAAQEAAEENGKAAAEQPAGTGDELARERLIVFLPDAPLVVELRMTIDGKPFSAAREELVDDVLKLADRDGDGRPTWEEIYNDPKRVFAERFDVQTRNVMHKEFLRTYDTNQNGLIDRGEARRIVSRAKSAGEAFSLEGSMEYRHSNRRQSIIRLMLDANGDEVLDADELAAAAQRLRARDANDDHLVSWDELDDSLAGDEQAMSARQNAYLNQPSALRLGPRASWDGIIYALTELYFPSDQIPDDASKLLKSLAGRLDRDGDGHLSYDEVRSLDSVEPDLVLAANFGRSGDLLAGISIVQWSADLGPAGDLVSHLPNGLLLRLADYRLQIVIDDRQPAAADTAAAGQFEMLDKDKNGYLEKEETGESAPELARIFAEADADADGKLYMNELTAYRRRQQPQTTAIRAVATDDQDVLFPLLDANHDGRLTKRELHAAAEVLSALDLDADGRLTLEELPGSLTLWLGRGLPMGASRPSRLVAAPLPASTGPDWFVYMDENRDQELSLDEFPGTAEKFHSLDLDGDGFVSSSEALSGED